jgi:hypothetical protein
MNTTWTWAGFFTSLLGVLQWTIAVLAVAGTLGLFGWIVMMIVRKDKAK